MPSSEAAGDQALRLGGTTTKSLGRGIYCLTITVDHRRAVTAFVPREIMAAGVHAVLSSSRRSAVGMRASANAFADSVYVTRLGYVRKAAQVNVAGNSNTGDIKLCQTDEERDVTRKTDSLLSLLTNAEKAAQPI